MIAGMTTIHAFPLDLFIVLDLIRRVEALVLWFDVPHVRRRSEFEGLLHVHGQHLQHVEIIESKTPWSPSTFREPQLRALDSIRPDYVLQPDSDETFGPGFPWDFDKFRMSCRDLMMFDYDMPTSDGAIVEKQPRARHCKVFRWREGLTFNPYRGFAVPTGLHSTYAADSRIQHYCCYTPELQQQMLRKPTLKTDGARKFYGKRILP